MLSYALLAFAVTAQANPLIAARQAVTANISPDAPTPAGCTGSVNYSFGIVANNISTTPSSVVKRQATQIGDGQVQAATGAANAVSQITE